MNRKILIGMSGAIGSGKSTLGRMVAGILELETYGFADPLKAAVNGIFGWDDRHANGELKEVVDPFWLVTPRRAYQTLGTDWGREMMREDIWLRRAEMVLNTKSGLVITDVRFPNEAEWVRAQGGLIVHVRRAGHIAPAKAVGHASESGFTYLPQDYVTRYCASLADVSDEAWCIAGRFAQEISV